MSEYVRHMLGRRQNQLIYLQFHVIQHNSRIRNHHALMNGSIHCMNDHFEFIMYYHLVVVMIVHSTQCRVKLI